MMAQCCLHNSFKPNYFVLTQSKSNGRKEGRKQGSIPPHFPAMVYFALCLRHHPIKGIIFPSLFSFIKNRRPLLPFPLFIYSFTILAIIRPLSLSPLRRGCDATKSQQRQKMGEKGAHICRLASFPYSPLFIPFIHSPLYGHSSIDWPPHFPIFKCASSKMAPLLCPQSHPSPIRTAGTPSFRESRLNWGLGHGLPSSIFLSRIPTTMTPNLTPFKITHQGLYDI